MKLLYLDCPMGVSGDMFLAALIDLGVDPGLITRELKKLPVPKEEIDVRVSKEVRHSISATSFRTRIRERHAHRTFSEIKKLIRESSLKTGVKDLSISIFKTIAEAEGKIHGIPPDEVHFHEVGAMDSIIDIVGAAVAVDSLGVDRTLSSPVPLGSGWADTMHGRIPIPAPATLEILKGVPTRSTDISFELTTPTGAAILKTIATDFGPMPDLAVERIGYGAGKKDFKEAANVLRAVLGSEVKAMEEEAERLFVLETNIDDMSPQIAGHLMEALFERGALDVYFTPVQMKKGRPGLLLTVLAAPEKKAELMKVIFEESTSIGVRGYPVERHCLARKIAKVKTPWGSVRVKVSMIGNKAVTVQPEYEDCRKIALSRKIPLKLVIDAAREAARKKSS